MPRITLDNCGKFFRDLIRKENLIIPDEDINLMIKDIKDRMSKMKLENVDLSEPIPGKNGITYGEQQMIYSVDQYLNEFLDKEIIASADKLTVQKRYDEIAQMTEDLKKFYPDVPGKDRSTERAMRAMIAIVYRSNDTTGTNPLTGFIDSIFKSKQASLIQKIKEIDPEITDVFAIFRDKTITDDVMRELHQMIMPGEVRTTKIDELRYKKATNNKNAQTIARALIEAISRPTDYELRSLGKDTNIFNFLPKVLFKTYKMRDLEYKGAKGREAFVQLMQDNLHDVHNTGGADKSTIAGDIYDNMMEIKDWRQADKIVRQYKKAYTSSDKTLGDTMPDQLTFKDADAFMEVNKLLGAELSLQEMVMRMLDESSRQLGLVKFAGADYENNLKKLVNAVKEGVDPYDIGTKTTVDAKGFRGGNFLLRKRLDGALNEIEALVNPSIAENMNASTGHTFLSAVRNFEIAKLGGAVISNIGDIASAIVVPKQRLGSGILRNIAGMSREVFGYAFNPAKRAETREVVAGLQDFSDLWIGMKQDRFRMISHQDFGSDSRFGEKALDWSSRSAHFVLNMTGFNHYNRTMSIGATSMVIREIGTWVKSRKSWSALSDAQKYNFDKYGLTELDYNAMLKAGTKILDAEGRFDIYSYSRYLRDEQGVLGTAPQMLKMTSLINDISETMVVKPDAIDRAAIRFFSKPRSTTEQVMRSVLQFQTFLFSHSRKILMHDYRKIQASFRSGSGISKMQGIQAAASLAQIVAPMFVLGMFVVQAKEWIKGNKGYNIDEAAIRAFNYTNILPFVGDLYWQNGGEKLFRTFVAEAVPDTYTDDNYRRPTFDTFYRRILGPTLNDLERVGQGGGQLLYGSLLKLVGDDPNADTNLRAGTTKLTRVLQGLDPLANMWMTRAVWRSIMYDTMFEAFNPQGYRRYKQRLIDEARNKRGGELYNSYGKLLNE